MLDKTTIIGNLGRDPEMRYTPSGQAVTNFSVAVNRKWAGADGTKHEQTVWYRVSAWGKQGEACNTYLHKGNKVYVEGQLRANENGQPAVYQKNDGTWAASFELNAQTVRFLSSNTGAGEADAPEADPEGDNIPF